MGLVSPDSQSLVGLEDSPIAAENVIGSPSQVGLDGSSHSEASGQEALRREVDDLSAQIGMLKLRGQKEVLDLSVQVGTLKQKEHNQEVEIARLQTEAKEVARRLDAAETLIADFGSEHSASPKESSMPGADRVVASSPSRLEDPPKPPPPPPPKPARKRSRRQQPKPEPNRIVSPPSESLGSLSEPPNAEEKLAALPDSPKPEANPASLSSFDLAKSEARLPQVPVGLGLSDLLNIFGSSDSPKSKDKYPGPFLDGKPDRPQRRPVRANRDRFRSNRGRSNRTRGDQEPREMIQRMFPPDNIPQGFQDAVAKEYTPESCQDMYNTYDSQLADWQSWRVEIGDDQYENGHRRFAIFTCAGDFNKVLEWMRCDNNPDIKRNWDLLVNYYGSDVEKENLNKFLSSEPPALIVSEEVASAAGAPLRPEVPAAGEAPAASEEAHPNIFEKSGKPSLSGLKKVQTKQGLTLQRFADKYRAPVATLRISGTTDEILEAVEEKCKNRCRTRNNQRNYPRN